MNKLISQPKTARLGFFLNWFSLSWVILVFTFVFINPVYASSDSNQIHQIKVHLSPYRLNSATGNWETTATLISYFKQLSSYRGCLRVAKVIFTMLNYENGITTPKYENNRVLV